MEKLKRAMKDLGEEVVKELIKQLLKADKKASGNLIRSIDYRLIEATDEFLLTISADSYLAIIDQGRRKGAKQPPTSAIIPWMKKRGIKGRDKKGRFITDKSTAFLIARSIKRNGIKPTNVIRKTIDEIYSKKMNLLEKAAIKDIEMFIDKIKFD